jgi:FlaG/FlaF family flagellin (archaellin)
MENLKSWAKSKPVLAIAVVLVLATIIYSLFFPGSPLPDAPV